MFRFTDSVFFMVAFVQISAETFRDCSEVDKSGPITLTLSNNKRFKTTCIEHNDQLWTVVLHKKSGGIKFDRGIFEYIKGFGNENIDAEFFGGLSNIKTIIDGYKCGAAEMTVELKLANDNFVSYASYGNVKLGAASQYKLNYRFDTFQSYHVHDGLTDANDAQFITSDMRRADHMCAGGWWRNCRWTCLTCDGGGMSWAGQAVTEARIMLRPARKCFPTDRLPFHVPVVSRDRKNWYVLMRSVLHGSLNWDRDWAAYRSGFGDLSSNQFWLGLEKMNAITRGGVTARFEFEFSKNKSAHHAVYRNFQIMDERQKYKLIGGVFDSAVSTARDGINEFQGSSDITRQGVHNQMPFSTYDRPNDRSGGNCAIAYKGGWWYNACVQTCFTITRNGRWYGWAHTPCVSGAILVEVPPAN